MSRLKIFISVLLFAFCAAFMLPEARATTLQKPSGQVLLTVSGAITQYNAGDEAAFDREMLQSLGMHKLRTSNPFETGIHEFEGVLLRDVLSKVGATGSKLTAYALDGYAVEIPVEDAGKYQVLLALVWNGKPMTVRNKGPIWVIYPVDRFDDLKDEKYSARSIWQLGRLVVQ